MVNGSDRHTPQPSNRNGYWFWLGIAGVWGVWFQYLPSVCSPALKLSKGSWEGQGQSPIWWGPAVTMKIEWIFTTWHYSSWLAAATPLVGPASTADGRYWKTLCQWKITEFCWSCVCACVRGEVGQTSIKLVIFMRGKENKWFLRLQKLLACKEPVSYFTWMIHVCFYIISFPCNSM